MLDVASSPLHERRGVLIVNPAAGGGRCGRRVGRVEQRLGTLGWKLHRVDTRGPGHATELAAGLVEDGERTLLVAGGDGTAFEVLNGVMTSPARVALGYLPLGTGNSFGRDLGVVDEDSAVRALVAPRTRSVDVASATHRGGRLYFVNLLSIGFSAEAGAIANRRFKALGTAGYIAATLTAWARLKHPVLPIALDGGPMDRRPCALLSFSNSTCTGGSMRIAPEADLSDGRLDVVRIGPLDRMDFLRTFPRLFDGTHVAHPLVECRRASRIDLELGGPTAAMVDGEVLSLDLQRIDVLAGALDVLA